MMQKAFFVPILMIWFSSQSFGSELSLFDTANLRDVNYFKGTIRRDVRSDEQFHFLHVIYDDRKQSDDLVNKCAAFRVQQENDRFIVATARHCVGYKEQEACEMNQIKITALSSIDTKFVGTCKKIIATSEKDDLFLMEIRVGSTDGDQGPFYETHIKRLFKSFKLAAYEPSIGTPLMMYGFPADPIRKDSRGRSIPTVIENCEVLPKESADAITYLKPEVYQLIMEKYQKLQDLQTAETIKALKALDLTLLKHNCSVYKGNSGGPIRIVGTMDVVGLPYDYWADYFEVVPRYFSRNFEASHIFVKRHRTLLEAEGIILSDAQPKVKLRPIPRRPKQQSI